MKVSFFSNYLTHHQVPISNELYSVLGEDYHFISCEPMEQERKEQGWELKIMYPYEVKAYGSEENEKQAMDLALTSDVLIIGAAPRKYWEARTKRNLLTLRYGERYFKKSRWTMLDLGVLRSHFKYDFCYRNNQSIHMLCASGYMADDCRFLHAFPQRLYKWGYFPELPQDNLVELLSKKSNNAMVQLLWVARFIDWKHPMDAIQVAEILKNEEIPFKLTMLGTGEMLAECEEYVATHRLSQVISLEGQKPFNKVQELMAQADILIHTADRQEGWGAVINEAMANGCAVIANQAIGAAPYLIKNGENGFTYDGTMKDLTAKLRTCISEKSVRLAVSKAAYRTLHGEWSPQNAATNLLKLMNYLLQGEKVSIESGPCSPA